MGVKLEIFRMMLYLSFPVTMFWISNQAEYFEEYVVKRKRVIYPPDHSAQFHTEGNIPCISGRIAIVSPTGDVKALQLQKLVVERRLAAGIILRQELEAFQEQMRQKREERILRQLEKEQ